MKRKRASNSNMGSLGKVLAAPTGAAPDVGAGRRPVVLQGTQFDEFYQFLSKTAGGDPKYTKKAESMEEAVSVAFGLANRYGLHPGVMFTRLLGLSQTGIACKRLASCDSEAAVKMREMIDPLKRRQPLASNDRGAAEMLLALGDRCLHDKVSDKVRDDILWAGAHSRFCRRKSAKDTWAGHVQARAKRYEDEAFMDISESMSSDDLIESYKAIEDENEQMELALFVSRFNPESVANTTVCDPISGGTKRSKKVVVQEEDKRLSL